MRKLAYYGTCAAAIVGSAVGIVLTVAPGALEGFFYRGG